MSQAKNVPAKEILERDVTWSNTAGLLWTIWVKLSSVELKFGYMRIIWGFTLRPSADGSEYLSGLFLNEETFRCGVSAGQVGPAGGVRTEVVLAQPGRVVGGGEHVAGGQRGREVVARLFVRAEVVLVQRLRFEDTEKVEGC